MKKIIAFIFAAAMLSAGVYAEAVEEEIIEVVSVYAVTTASEDGQAAEEQAVAPDMPVVVDAVETAIEETIVDEEYLPEEDGIPQEEEFPPEEPFPELGDVYKYLETNGYPDYLSFIHNGAAAINGYDPTSGEEYQPKMTYWWEVGVVNATAAQKAEIQALIDELYPIENIIDFTDCTYSHAEREAMMPEIREKMYQLYPNLSAVDVYLIRNTEQIGVAVDFPADGDVPELDMIKEQMYSIYGNTVFVEYYFTTTDDAEAEDFCGVPEVGGLPTVGVGAETEIAVEEEIDEVVEEDGIAVGSNVDGDVDSAPTVGNVTTSEETYVEIAAIASPEQKSSNTLLWVCIAAALVIALGAVAFIYRAKLIPVFATNNGDLTSGKLTRKQTEEAVKNSEAVPDDSVLQAIKQQIEK